MLLNFMWLLYASHFTLSWTKSICVGRLAQTAFLILRLTQQLCLWETWRFFKSLLVHQGDCQGLENMSVFQSSSSRWQSVPTEPLHWRCAWTNSIHNAAQRKKSPAAGSDQTWSHSMQWPTRCAGETTPAGVKVGKPTLTGVSPCSPAGTSILRRSVQGHTTMVTNSHALTSLPQHCPNWGTERFAYPRKGFAIIPVCWDSLANVLEGRKGWNCCCMEQGA